MSTPSAGSIEFDEFERLMKQIVDAQTDHLDWMMDEYRERMGEIAMSPEFFKRIGPLLFRLVRRGHIDAELLSFTLAELEGLRALYAAEAKRGRRSPRAHAL